jgi:hypothetical protein
MTCLHKTPVDNKVPGLGQAVCPLANLPFNHQVVSIPKEAVDRIDDCDLGRDERGTFEHIMQLLLNRTYLGDMDSRFITARIREFFMSFYEGYR